MRGGRDRRLVCERVATGLPPGQPTADRSRWRGSNRARSREGGVAAAGGGSLWVGGHGLPLPTGDVEVEPDRAPAIQQTQTSTGRRVRAELVPTPYVKGIKVPDA